MILLGRVVVVALGRVVRVVRIMVLGRVVRVVRIMVLGRVVRVVRIMVLGRVVRVTSGYDHGEDEEQGHQQRRHKAVLRHCRSLSLSSDLSTWREVGVVVLCCLLSLWSMVRDGRGDL
jgi:hypothetical protein